MKSTFYKGPFVALLVLLASGPPGAALAQTGPDPFSTEIRLPPEIPWEGRSLALARPPDDPWATPFEKSDLTRSPSYQETVSWLHRLCEEAPELEMISIGRSDEGRDIWMVVASAGGPVTPEGLRRSGKPVLLAQAGIHSGEIDGKDAGMMLLRDMAVRGVRRDLLEKTCFLFVPILSVDAHERRSPYSRMNQRGPEVMGWRTNSRNLNLNRDYAKLDTPETRAVVRALGTWQPDLYLDIHVTDGIDYQYDVTWGSNGTHAWSPEVGRWLEGVLRPALERRLREMGHVPGPLVFARDSRDLEKGIVSWTASPRFSNGYGDARHQPTVLVENHSLKPYRQRVLGTYVFLEGCLDVLSQRARELREARRRDETRRFEEVPLDWTYRGSVPDTVDFLAVGYELVPSSVMDIERVAWTGEKKTVRIPRFSNRVPDATATRPRAYWIPPAWTEVIERLEIHGVQMERIQEEREVEVEMYRIDEPELAGSAYEGHVRVSGTEVPERRVERFAPGSVRVPTDQPLGDLAVLLLEPRSPDSFFRWGFFLEILQRTEYAEGYVMAPMAERMLQGDPELSAAFESRLEEDPEFAGDPGARLEWFYRQTPFFDDRWRLYPVAREIESGP
jgi:hypothetical protein